MTTLYLVRHGESEWNAEGRYQGQMNPPLSALGQQQAEILAARLAPIPFDAIFSSDLCRAVQTAEALARRVGLPIWQDARWREIQQGAWEGHLTADIQRTWPQDYAAWRRDPWHNDPTDGEPLRAVQARVIAAAEEVARRYPNGRVVVFTHRLPIALSLVWYQGYDAQRIWALEPENCGWEVITV